VDHRAPERRRATGVGFPEHRRGLRRSHPEVAMRSIVLALIGVPIPIILLLAFCTHHL
jgi:hypothetical protein